MWSKERIWNWYRQQPWIVGFNYLPSNAVNSTAMWQKEVFDAALVARELRAAAAAGYNACRVFVQYLLWKQDSDALFEVFDSFLRIASDCGIRVMPILFDDCAFALKEPYLGPQDEPAPGVHNSCWTPSPGFTNADDPAEQPLLQAYVTEFVGRYAADERILLWDLYNEPCNSGREEKSLPLLKNVFAWARSCSPAQPLTSGVWRFFAADEACIGLSDIISFHDYGPLDTTRQRIAALGKYGRPLLCTEWLHRPAGNTMESHLPCYKENNVGTFHWGLVAGKTQTYLNWDMTQNPTEGMPELWQHDVFYPDLTPYRPQELQLVTALSSAPAAQ